MKSIIKISSLVVFLCILTLPLFSQIQKLRQIPSEQFKSLRKSDNIPIIVMPKFDINKLLLEDKESEGHFDKPLRFAIAFDTIIDIKKEGLAEVLDNNNKIWRIKILSQGAHSLNVTFKKFNVPFGAELFIYNTDKSQKLGAFTEENNNEDKILPVQPINGDDLTIEYYEPGDVSFSGEVVIGRVGHAYRDVFDSAANYDGQFRTSQSCNVDINCPEGVNWQNEKLSVCRILIDNTYLCTGSLMNNTSNNRIPYVLTANHCISTNSEAANSVYVFNYDSPYCNGPDGSISNSISVSTLKSTWSTSDFTLVQLSSTPSFCSPAYFNGWDNSGNTNCAPVTCIHHPSGDVKKISRDDENPSTVSQYFWQVTDYTVGTVEHGSSGAPLYDLNHHVIGQIHGGNDIFCNDSEKSTYGKISKSWLGGGTSATRLKDWLDPINSGKSALDGAFLFYVSGSTLVCSSGTTFTVNNLPTGSSILTWDKSDNLSLVSATGNTAVFASVFAANSAGWVQPTIITTCDTVKVPKYVVWVGTPQITNQKIDGVSSSNMAVCPGNHYLTVTPVGGNAGSATWTVPAGIVYMVGTNQLDFTFPTSSTGFSITCRSTNSCGTGTNASFYLSKKTYGCPSSLSMVLYPNPASTDVTININENSTLISSDSTNIVENQNSESLTYRINIYNSKSSLVYTATRSGNSFNIPLVNLRDGAYLIEVSNGGNRTTQQLIIKNN